MTEHGSSPRNESDKPSELVDALDNWLSGGEATPDVTSDDAAAELQISRFASEAEINQWCAENYWLKVDVALDEKNNGVLEIKKASENVELTFSFLGYSRSQQRIKDQVGWQVLHFTNEQYRSFLGFACNNQHCNFVLPYGAFGRFEVQGITAQSFDDFLPAPRFQVEYIEMDYDADNQLVEAERTTQFMEITEQLRIDLKAALVEELQKKRGGGAGLSGSTGHWERQNMEQPQK